MIDIDKFKKLNVESVIELNLESKLEDKLAFFKKKDIKAIGKGSYKILYPQGSQPGVM